MYRALLLRHQKEGASARGFSFSTSTSTLVKGVLSATPFVNSSQRPFLLNHGSLRFTILESFSACMTSVLTFGNFSNLHVYRPRFRTLKLTLLYIL